MTTVTPLKVHRAAISGKPVAFGEFVTGDTIPPGVLPPEAARTDQSKSFSAQQVPFSGGLTDAATIAWDGDTNGQVVSVTTSVARTFGAPTNIKQNALYVLVLSTGGFTPSWNTAFKWPSGGVPSALSSGVYVFTFVGGASNTLIPTGPGYLTGA